jgi:hypothetical protein
MIKRGFVLVGKGKMAQRYECRKCHHTTVNPIRIKQ